MTLIPLRIALVITELEVGGAERCLANLACGLDRSRFAPEVYALAPPPPESRDQLVAMVRAAGIPVHFLGFRHGWQMPLAVRHLAAHLRRQNPAVVQSMLFHANVVASLAVRRAASLLSTGIRVADPARWRYAVERRTSRRANRIVCVSDAVAAFAADTMRLPHEKLLVIPNGVDTQAIADCLPADLPQLGLPHGHRSIVCVTRLAHQKGVDRLIRHAPRLMEAAPHHDLVLVGDGPDARVLRRLAVATGVSDRVHFLGWRPNVPEILKASDVMLLPSRWEGMPNVLLEAMSCARPVVCTSTSGVQQLLGPLAGPQTVSVDDTQSLVEKAVAIINDRRLADRLGTENQRRVTECFSMHAMICQYQRLFEDLATLAGPA
ncbi:MAG: glycosyltransferase [Planctomycetes bacterium]|nr:glycosyltransferase [Planctomycetota bacterium]